MNKNLKGLLLTMLVLLTLPTTTWAMDPIRAPLNPDFIDYHQNLEATAATSARQEPLGLVPAPFKRQTDLAYAKTGEEAALPAQFDLRTTGIVPPVRNQVPYGSCWTFGTYASLESHLAKKDGYFTDLSENNLMWNNGFDGGPNTGGHREMSVAYLARWDGPVLESLDPYLTPKKTGLPPAYHVQAVEFIPSNSDAIKQALMTEGILSAGMYMDEDQESGYYNWENHAYYYNGQDSANHEIAIVGWDDSFSKDHFIITPANDGAWIIRNSWSEGLHDEGYFYLSYDDTRIGDEPTAFNNAEASDNYKRIYQYDPLGLTGSLGYPFEDAIMGANIFEAQANENLKAIATHTVATEMTLDIAIYTDVEADRPDSGNLRLRQSAFFDHAGYYTIDLDDLVPLVKGEKFAIVIDYHSPHTETPLPIEGPVEDYSSQATSKPQESFIRYSEATDWVDISGKSNDNICIKAFTGGTSLVPRTTYRTHVENEGWQAWKNNGAMAGTSGQGLRLEAIELKSDTPDYHVGLAYKTHIENIGWEENYSYDGKMSGTSGQGLCLEAIQMNLTGRDAKKFNLYYRVHAENLGWLDWAKNGEEAGTAGFSYRLEGIEVKILEKGAPPPGGTARPFVEHVK